MSWPNVVQDEVFRDTVPWIVIRISSVAPPVAYARARLRQLRRFHDAPARYSSLFSPRDYTHQQCVDRGQQGTI